MISGGFKFNFHLQNDVTEVSEKADMQKRSKGNIRRGVNQIKILFLSIIDSGNNRGPAAPACEILIEPYHHKLTEQYKFVTVNCGNASFHLKYALLEDLKHLNALHKLQLTSCSTLLNTVTIDSDLIPGVYEGGLKIWEGSCDLLDYLSTGKIELNGARVLELGCGAGLPGIVAVLHGASCVTFQDYNPEVIHLFTIPNLLANITTESMGLVKFFAGDWSELNGIINSDDEPTLKYDFVLTSETIYCVDSQPILLEIIKKQVKPCTGKALIAAKSHYFGVGGSMEMFKTLVKNDGFFKCSTVVTMASCSVPREVILLEQLY